MRLVRFAVALVCTLVLAVGVLLVGSSAASADPLPSSGQSDLQLPQGFPEDLKQYVGGTPEFKSAPWMTGSCAGHGGDVGQYLNAMDGVEGRLMYWAQSDDDRANVWRTPFVGLHKPADPQHPERSEPPASALPPVYPSGDAAGAFQEAKNDGGHAYCSDQITSWASPASTTFGFTWASKPDAASVAKYRNSLYSKAFEKAQHACDSRTSLTCTVAYFVDCTQAKPGDDLGQCQRWNANVAGVVQGMDEWAHRNDGPIHSFEGFVNGLVDAVAAGGRAAADAFHSVWHAVATVAAFVANPTDGLSKLANSVKSAALSLTRAVLGGLNTITAFDPGKGDFLARYAKVMALGWVLTAFFFLGSLLKAAREGDSSMTVGIVRRLALTFGAMAFAPAIFALLETTATKATTSISDNFTSLEAGKAITALNKIGLVTAEMVPGGVVAGLVLFALMFIGAALLFFGLIVQRFGLEIAAVMFALVAAVYVHPTWRTKVTKFVYVIIGLALVKPLTILVVGGALGEIADNLNVTAQGSPLQILGALTLAAVGLLIVGFAPLSLLKWAPILPTAADSHGGSGGGGASAGLPRIGGSGGGSSRGGGAAPRTESHSISSGASSPGGSGKQGSSRLGADLRSSSGSEAGGGASSAKTGQAGAGASSAGGGPGAAGKAGRGAGAAAGGGSGAAGGAAAGGAAGGAAAAAGPVGVAGVAALKIGQAMANQGRALGRHHVPEGENPEPPASSGGGKS